MPLVDELIALENQRFQRAQAGQQPSPRSPQPGRSNLLVNTLVGNFRKEQNERRLRKSLGDVSLEEARSRLSDPESQGRVAEGVTGGLLRREDASGVSSGLLETLIPALLGERSAGRKSRAATRTAETERRTALDVQALKNKGSVASSLAEIMALTGSGENSDINPVFLSIINEALGNSSTRTQTGSKKQKRKLVNPRQDIEDEVRGLLGN